MFDELNDTFKNVYKLARMRAENKDDILDESKLQEYMMSLDCNTIKILGTIMYLGRDKEYNKNDRYEKRYEKARIYYARLNFYRMDIDEELKDKHAIIEQLLEKRFLDKYLLEGFKILGITIYENSL